MRYGRRRLKKITIREVAQEAGVALGTVSRVLNGSGPVHENTAARVRAAVDALGYTPNAAGRSLRSGASRAVGILVPTLSNPIFARSVDSAEDAARDAGFATLMTQSRYDPGREESAVAELVARGVEGLILTLSDAKDHRTEALAAHGVPIVLLYNPPGSGCHGISLVTVDSRRAVDEATALLIAKGHRRIAFLGGAFASSDRARARYDGYRDAMSRTGLPVWEPVEVDFLADAPAFDAAIGALLTRLSAPTALIASNDFLALQAIAAARRLSLRVPEDLSVIGFDGLAIARASAPQLATVRQPAAQMGAAASKLLFDMIEGAPARTIVMPHQFLSGGTLAVAPGRSGPLRAGPDTASQRDDLL